MCAATILPSPSTASVDPEAAATVVGNLVRASLSEDWRVEHRHEAVLNGLSELIKLHLGLLTEGEAGVSEVASAERYAVEDVHDPHETACTLCLKLARNLCVNSQSVQQHFLERGLLQWLVARVRTDFVARVRERKKGWREVVPSFIINVVAGNALVAKGVLDIIFPHDLAIICSLPWHRPELAFMLVHNLIATCDTTSIRLKQLIEDPDGHCIVYALLSYLCREEEDEAQVAKTGEWASIFFSGLWLKGGFPAIYMGIKRLTPACVYRFLFRAAGMQEDVQDAGAKPPASTNFWRLSENLCGHAEALGLLWQTVHGLLAGPGGTEGASDCSTMTADFGKRLLEDDNFVALVHSEMMECLAWLSEAWSLDWTPMPASAEACAVLGIEPCALQTAGENTDPHLPEETPVAEQGTPAPEAEANAGGQSCSKVECQRSLQHVFNELLHALVQLAAIPQTSGVRFPSLLIGLHLTANLGFIDALHKHRFGKLDSEAPQRKQHKGAAEASQACLLVDQVRLCANVLYERQEAQNFVRLVGGLRVLLSHCYADHEVPLLREAGVFAVRNATHGNEANQAVAQALLSEQRAAANAGERLVEDLTGGQI